MFHRRSSFLLLLAMAAWSWWATSSPGAAPPASSRFLLLRNDEAWERLPRASLPLPAWARALASSMPGTTAAMLELDYLQRANNPLGPVQAGKLRWAAASALRCDYG